MGDNYTVIQKFWFLSCLIWLIFIFAEYGDHFHRSAGSVLIILFVGFLPMITFLISVARSKYRDSQRHRLREPDPLPMLSQSMIAAGLIPPEPREPPHTNLVRNSSIGSLETYVYQKEGKTEEDDCVVCLGQLQQGELVVKLQFCSHFFHEKCINPWLQQHKTCPICRSKVNQKVAESSMVGHIAAVV